RRRGGAAGWSRRIPGRRAIGAGRIYIARGKSGGVIGFGRDRVATAASDDPGHQEASENWASDAKHAALTLRTAKLFRGLVAECREAIDTFVCAVGEIGMAEEPAVAF